MQLFYEEAEGDVLIVAVDGGLNRQTAGQFVDRVQTLVDGGLRKIIVDCARLTYLNSYGLGVLLRIHKRMAQHGGDVKVAGLTGMVADLLRATHLNTLFDLYPDVSAAKLAFRDKAE